MAHYQAIKVRDGVDPRERLKFGVIENVDAYQPSETCVSAIKFPEGCGKVFKVRSSA